MTSPVLSSLSLFPATPEQTRESRIRSFEAWAGGLSLENYLARDASVDVSEAGRDHRLVTWVLAPRDAPDTLDFMCSCETFRRDGLVARQSDDKTSTASVEDVVCYGIASVFTPPSKRGKGFARHMMRLVHWILAPSSSLPHQFPLEWGAPPVRPAFVELGCCSVLYSDVGENFYSACGSAPHSTDGWLVTGPISTVCSVQRILDLSSTTSTGSRPWKLLDEGSVDAIWKLDSDLIKREMAEAHHDSTSIAFTFLPTKGVAAFQYKRQELRWKVLQPLPRYWGVCLLDGHSNIDASTFATWTLDISPNATAFVVTRIRCAPEVFRDLLLVLAEYAKQYPIDTIEIWNLPDNLQGLTSLVEGRTFARHEHLPSIKWYGKENTGDVSWIHNEKFCWC